MANRVKECGARDMDAMLGPTKEVMREEPDKKADFPDNLTVIFKRLDSTQIRQLDINTMTASS